MKKYLMILALSITAANVAAESYCLIPYPQAPAPVNGAQASAQEILSYRAAVLDYMDRAESRLSCLGQSLKYNRLVYQMNEVGKTFNSELRKYYSQVAQR